MRLPELLSVITLLALAGSAGLAGARPAAEGPAAPPAATPDAAARGTRFPGPFPARILAVIDGDTVEARITIWPDHDIVTRVRLAGIDAAEMSATCAEERDMAILSRDALAGMLKEVAVRVADVRRDKYAGRVVARLIDGDGADIGARMLTAGYAIAYDGGRRQPWCAPTVTARR